MRALFLVLIVLASCLPSFAAEPGPRTVNLAVLGRWLQRGESLQTIQADFVQTRALKTLREPLANPGRFWFRAPDHLRWELGNPARTIFLRRANEILLIEPLAKKATRLDPATLASHSAARGMGLMRFPMATSLDDFKQQFDVLDLLEKEDWCELSLLPKEIQARKFLKAIQIRFSTTTGELHHFEMITREGSILRNAFSNVRLNQPLADAVFAFDLTGYEVVDAKK